MTGPREVGKVSLLTALVDELNDAAVPHAAIELETLAWHTPRAH
jgi:hypothetical protein